METQAPVLFAPQTSHAFAEAVAGRLGFSLSALEERDFEDGEHKTRPLTGVRGRDVFVVQSLYSDGHYSVNDKLCRLLFLLGGLRDAGAGRITAVLPYLAYARKDRKTQPRDPVTTRYMAELLEAVGVDTVVTLDVHNLAAYQNAFRCQSVHLQANELFVEHFAARLPAGEAVTVVSPDEGGMKRAERFRQALSRRLQRELPMACMQKARAHGVLSVGRLMGEAADGTAIIIDDLISTGGTLLGAARACRAQGARRVYAAASHGVFAGDTRPLFTAPELEHVIVTDTIPPFRVDPALAAARLTVLSTADLFAEAIRRLHAHEPLEDLLPV
jgi:ribose-phosphate pyrophosphokinase